MAANDFRVVQAGRIVNFINGTAALDVGTMVKVASNVLAAAGDGDSVAGVLLKNCAASETQCPVMIEGVVEGTAASGVNFAIGAAAYMAASGKLDAGSQNNVTAGYVVNTDPSTAGLVQILLTSTFTSPTTHA